MWPRNGSAGGDGIGVVIVLLLVVLVVSQSCVWRSCVVECSCAVDI